MVTTKNPDLPRLKIRSSVLMTEDSIRSLEETFAFMKRLAQLSQEVMLGVVNIDMAKLGEEPDAVGYKLVINPKAEKLGSADCKRDGHNGRL